MHKLLIAIISAVAFAVYPGSSHSADDAQLKIFKPGEPIVISHWLVEFGGRYLHSADKHNWGDFGASGAAQVSGLASDDLATHSVDALGRVGLGSAAFAKGYFGGDSMTGRRLHHQDFPPVIKQYSAWLLQQADGSLAYAAADPGYSVWKAPHYELRAFIGRHHWKDRRSGFASTQLTINADHCFNAPISPAVNSLDNDATWNSLRLWCGGVACTYTRPKAIGRCGANVELSQRRGLPSLRSAVKPLPEDGTDNDRE
jgi:hypothetical protein